MHAGGPAEDREGAPALRLRLVVAREPRRRPAALGHGLGVARGVDPVLEGDRAHPDRREERAKLVGHDLSLPNTGRLPPPATARLPFECMCSRRVRKKCLWTGSLTPRRVDIFRLWAYLRGGPLIQEPRSSWRRVAVHGGAPRSKKG